MTPTDILPARFTPTADAASTRSVAAKSGKDEGGSSDSDFRDLLKQISGDKEQPQKAPEGQGRDKDTVANGRARTLETAKAALAEARSRQAKDLRMAERGDKKSDVEAEPAGDVDSVDATADGPVVDQEPPLNAVAMLLSLAHKNDAPHAHVTQQPSPNTGQSDGNSKADPAAAAEVADRTLREVKVVSVKVETHFAAVHTDAATTGFAQRLAMAQVVGGSGQAGQQLDAMPGKVGAEAGIGSAAVTSAETSADVGAARGQMFAARGDRHGAENPGAGSGKGSSDGKPATGLQAAAPTQRTSTAGAEASQANALQTPMQQLSNRLLATAQELQQAASATPAGGATNDPSSSSAPVRVLSINLHPEELGSVTVRMSMVAGNLEVQIDAEMPDTAQMLRTDSDQISDLLRSAGIQVDGITIRAASPDFVSTSGGSNGSFFDQQPQSQSGGAQSDARGSGGHQRGNEHASSFGRSASSGQEDENRTQRAAGTGLYV